MLVTVIIKHGRNKTKIKDPFSKCLSTYHSIHSYVFISDTTKVQMYITVKKSYNLEVD